MPINDAILRGLYGRLTGIQRSTMSNGTIHDIIGHDYDGIVDALDKLLSDSVQHTALGQFKLPHGAYYKGGGTGPGFCRPDVLRARVEQLLGYMQSVYFTNDKIVEIGSLYNTISDAQLKDRCSDLLTAQGAFDRAINQATLILEDRIRNKANLQNESLQGTELVNRAINSQPSKSILVISDEQGEHEGIAHICRGVVGAFRNPTHHRVLDNYSREDALRLCGFIDQLLGIIDRARVQKI